MRSLTTIRNPRVVGLLARLRRNGISQSRWNSTQPPSPEPNQTSPHVGFYKTFARPIAKVLLMATFTYQLAYWAWVKLEKDEIKDARKAQIQELEQQLKELKESKEVAVGKNKKIAGS